MNMSLSLPFPAIIGVLHLDALPGAPGYNGDFPAIRRRALEEARIYEEAGLSAVIVENFGDAPFFKDNVPAETIAGMSVITSDIVRELQIPVGVNILRNDACAAIAVASCAGAKFIRVNIHAHAALTDQGIIESRAAQTLRYRKNLGADISILADLRVKHAAPLANLPLGQEIKDLEERGQADGLIVTGSGTGESVDPGQITEVLEIARKPVFIGSGVKAEDISRYKERCSGFIIGSAFKQDGQAGNPVDPARVQDLMLHVKQNQ